MPGICAIINRSSGVDQSSDLAGMLRCMRHRVDYQVEDYLDASVSIAMGCVTLDFIDSTSQSASHKDRSVVVIMHGELYSPNALRERLKLTGADFRSHSQAEIVLHGYLQEGKAFFRRLDGSFVAVIWDRRKRQLLVVKDHFGLLPLYYALLPDRFAVASEIKPLLHLSDLSRQQNKKGLAQFFSFGQLIGHETFYESVKYIPPGAWFEFNQATGRLTEDRYWTLNEICAKRSSYSEAKQLDLISDAFGEAVRRQTENTGHLGLSLSGGLDARTILAVIDHDTTPIKSVCLGVEGSLDHRCATKLAGLTNRDHHPFILSDQVVADYNKNLLETVRLTDGHYLDQGIVLPTLEFYRELGVQVLLRGHAGELMHFDKAYNYSLDEAAWALKTSDQLEEWLLKHLSAYMLDQVSRPLFADLSVEDTRELARDSLKACLKEADGIDPLIHQIWYLFTTQRLREIGLSLSMIGSVVTTRVPYYDKQLVELLMSAPAELKVGDKIHTHILRRYRPEFIKIVNANTGAPVGASRIRNIVSKFHMRVLAKLGVKGYQPYARLGLWLRRELKSMVRDVLLDECCLERGVFDPDTVRQVVRQHQDEHYNHTFLIMAMMIYELGRNSRI